MSSSAIIHLYSSVWLLDTKLEIEEHEECRNLRRGLLRVYVPLIEWVNRRSAMSAAILHLHSSVFLLDM